MFEMSIFKKCFFLLFFHQRALSFALIRVYNSFRYIFSIAFLYYDLYFLSTFTIIEIYRTRQSLNIDID
jgi:hypothetical protein